jgi:hypothetical protein
MVTIENEPTKGRERPGASNMSTLKQTQESTNLSGETGIDEAALASVVGGAAAHGQAHQSPALDHKAPDNTLETAAHAAMVQHEQTIPTHGATGAVVQDQHLPETPAVHPNTAAVHAPTASTHTDAVHSALPVPTEITQSLAALAHGSAAPTTAELLVLQQQMATFAVFTDTVTNTLKEQSDMLRTVAKNFRE